jgi:hypothetical protein
MGTFATFVACGLGISLIGGLISLAQQARHPVVATIALVAGVALGLAVIVRAVVVWRQRPPALVIDRVGIVPNPRKPASRVAWSDLSGAHLALLEPPNTTTWGPRFRYKIVALELVDPADFWRRREMRWGRWLGYDTGVRRDYFPLPYGGLDTDSDRLMYIIRTGIQRNGRPAPARDPRAIYESFFP